MCSLFSSKKDEGAAEPVKSSAEAAGQEGPAEVVFGDGEGVPLATAHQEELSKLQKQVEEHKDKYLRLLADFENVRKRTERERGEFVKYANESLLAEFVNALDDLERTVDAAKANHQDYAAFLKGIEMVMARLNDMLKKNQVRPIEAVGRKFDPLQHEAMLQIESPDQEDDTVVEELQKGYLYGEKVLRTAKVKVAKRI